MFGALDACAGGDLTVSVESTTEPIEPLGASVEDMRGRIGAISGAVALIAEASARMQDDVAEVAA